MIALALAVLTVLADLVGFVARPRSLACPSQLWLGTGVQPDGRFGCWLSVDVDDTPDTRTSESSYRGVVWSRVWCAEGERPRQDGVRVWCARSGGA